MPPTREALHRPPHDPAKNELTCLPDPKQGRMGTREQGLNLVRGAHGELDRRRLYTELHELQLGDVSRQLQIPKLETRRPTFRWKWIGIPRTAHASWPGPGSIRTSARCYLSRAS